MERVGNPRSYLLREALEFGEAGLDELLVDCVGLGGVEVEDVGDVVDFDGVEAVDGVFEGFGEGVHVFDGAAIDLGDDLAGDAVVADGGGGGDDTAEEDEPIAAFLVVLGITEGIEESEGRAGFPFFAEGFEVGTAEILKDDATFDEVGGRLVVDVVWDEGVDAPLEDGGDGHCFAVAEDFQFHRVADFLFAADEVGPEEAAVAVVVVVAAAVHGFSVEGEEDVFFLQAGGFGGAAGEDAADVEAAVIISEAEVGAELRVFGEDGGHAEGGEADVVSIGDVSKEECDDLGGEDVAHLILGVVTSKNADEFAVSGGGEGVAAGGALHGTLHLVGEEVVSGDEAGELVYRADRADGADGIAVVFELPNVEGSVDIDGAVGLEGFDLFDPSALV